MNSRCSWTTTTAGLLLAGAALLPVATARAEVSLVPAKRTVEARVDVRATAQGPWSLLGQPTARTLNPAGDLLGDGFPGTAARSDWACAAWVRPAEGQVLLAVGREGAWETPLVLAAEAAIGSPRPVILADGSVLLGWTEAVSGEGLRGRMALVTPDEGPAYDGFDGPSLVLGGSELGTQAAVLALVDRGSGSFELILASPIKPPNEPPLFRLQTVGWVDGRDGSVSEVAAVITSTIQPLPDEGEVLGVVHWWSAESTLSYVLLLADGGLSPKRELEQANGKVQNPRALLRHLLKAEGLQGN